MAIAVENPVGTNLKASGASPQKAEHESAVALAFVGSVFPNSAKYRTQAFSPAGRMFQENLLIGLKNAGLPPSQVISFLSIPSFPGSRRAIILGENVLLSGDIPARLVTFVNVTPAKQVLIGIATMWNLFKWGWRTRKSHRVVYQYNLTVPPGVFTLLAAKLIGATAIVSLNDINIPGQTVSNSLLNRLDFWLNRKLIPQFDGHIAVSDAIMQDFFPGREYVRVEGGVQSVLFDTPPISASSKGQPFTITFAGSLDPVNGIGILLEAFSKLESSDYRLLIAGWGPQEEAVKAAAARDARIGFLGVLDFGELLHLYSCSDLLVSIRPTKALQTRYFFPSKTMEYLASGTPVVATCTGHTEEEFGSVCYLLKDESPEGLAALLRSIAGLPAEVRREKGLQARQFMQAHKTWDRQGKKIARFIREKVFARTGGK
jgi:glycosyltransferase involved in cell wall biosynthesis